MTPRKQCFPRHNSTDVHVSSQTVAAHARPAQDQGRWGPSTERGMEQGVPFLTEKLPAVDTGWQRQNWFSPMEPHWVYQPQFRAVPMPRSRWPTQNKPSNIFVEFWFHIALFWLFPPCIVLLHVLILIFLC